jgi:hypothetical protein
MIFKSMTSVPGANLTIATYLHIAVALALQQFFWRNKRNIFICEYVYMSICIYIYVDICRYM